MGYGVCAADVVALGGGECRGGTRDSAGGGSVPRGTPEGGSRTGEGYDGQTHNPRSLTPAYPKVHK